MLKMKEYENMSLFEKLRFTIKNHFKKKNPIIQEWNRQEEHVKAMYSQADLGQEVRVVEYYFTYG